MGNLLIGQLNKERNLVTEGYKGRNRCLVGVRTRLRFSERLQNWCIPHNRRPCHFEVSGPESSSAQSPVGADPSAGVVQDRVAQALLPVPKRPS